MIAFVPPLLAFALRPRHFRKLFESFGDTFPVPDDAKPLEIARALWGIDVSPGLFAALDDLAEFATANGIFALEEAAGDTGFRFPRALSGARIAAWLLRRRGDAPRVEAVRERAHLRIERAPPPLARSERVAPVSRPMVPLEQGLCLLEQRLRADAECTLGGLDDSGVVRIAVVRRLSEDLSVEAYGDGLVHRTRRRVAADLLTIDAAAGRFSVTSDDPRKVSEYQLLVGEIFFSAPNHFDEEPSFTLKCLTKLAGVGLSAVPLPKGVLRVRVVELEWSDGERAYFTAKGSNALEVYALHGGPSGGYIAAAVLRLDIQGAERPVDAAIRLPHLIGIREERYEPLIRKTLFVLGALSPGLIPDDVWTLAPWIHPSRRWIKVIGVDGTRRLMEAGILETVQTRLVAGEGDSRFGWSYISFPLTNEPDKMYAVADDPALISRTVSAKDGHFERLSLPALEKLLREQLDLQPPPRGLPESRFLDLGVKRSTARTFHMFAVMRAPRPMDIPELLTAIARTAKGETPVLLLPEGRTFGGGVFEVPLTARQLLGVDSPFARVYSAIERELDAEGLVEPWQLAAEGVRLVLSPKSGRAWFDGVLIPFNESEWLLLTAVAPLGALGLETKVMETTVFRKFSAGVVRNVALQVRDRIRTGFESVGRPLPVGADKILQSVSGTRWRIAVPFEVR